MLNLNSVRNYCYSAQNAQKPSFKADSAQKKPVERAEVTQACNAAAQADAGDITRILAEHLQHTPEKISPILRDMGDVLWDQRGALYPELGEALIEESFVFQKMFKGGEDALDQEFSDKYNN